MKLFNEYRNLRRENYILFFGRIMTSLGSMVWPMFTMILSQKLHMEAGTIALLLTLAGIAGVPLNLIGGKLADHYSKKNIIVVCDLISIAGSLWCAMVPLSFMSIMIFGISALLQQMETPAYSALVADITPSKDRERAYSLNYLGMNLGMVLAPTISGILFKNHLDLMFLINGLAIASSTTLIFFFLKNTDRRKEENSTAAVYEQEEEKGSAFAVLKANRIILLFIVIASIETAVYIQYSYLMPLDLGHLFGDNGALIYGTISSLNCVVVVLFTPVITRLFAGAGDCKKMLYGLLCILCGYLIFRIFSAFIPAYYVAMLVFTWGEIFCTLSVDPYLTRRIPASHRGRIIAVSTVCTTLAGSLGSLATGQLYEHISSASAWLLVFMAGLCGVILTIVLIRRDRTCYPDLYQNRQS